MKRTTALLAAIALIALPAIAHAVGTPATGAARKAKLLALFGRLKSNEAPRAAKDPLQGTLAQVRQSLMKVRRVRMEKAAGGAEKSALEAAQAALSFIQKKESATVPAPAEVKTLPEAVAMTPTVVEGPVTTVERKALARLASLLIEKTRKEMELRQSPGEDAHDALRICLNVLGAGLDAEWRPPNDAALLTQSLENRLGGEGLRQVLAAAMLVQP